ncbi:uncharacterized protein B0P05DRAFT_579659 [Gilbertella persicaria]|uniref:uncharacterized protein n=1 Tax=Gilbertella persicaria TaxID=101096 RepID=UPI0022200175|nr:uncharacterized protein B0P05DRAFT_579659 [Gilbertella persicaria]KAI8077290.1 hypothetical protein B0P05DRAFT_579659 [Gilbertella persicaria]
MKLANEKEHVYPFQLKPTSNNNNGSTNNTLITPKSIRYTDKRKNQKLYKKEKLKEARDEYEELIEDYFHQLTVGCQQKECRNKFCASGRGGIMSLQPQAALIMAIQLASMPNSRLCSIQRKSIVENSQCYYSLSNDPTTTTKPFLQSLFASTPFSDLLLKQKTQQQTSRQPKTRKRQSETTKPHWTTDFWRMLSRFTRNPSPDQSARDDEDEDDDRKSSLIDNVVQQLEDHSDSSYYQLDQDDKSLAKLHHLESDDNSSTISSNSSSSQSGMLLAISPISVNLDLAVEHLHQAIVTKSISESNMDTWCRSVFQSWEGVGNSFLMPQSGFSLSPLLQHKDISFINLDDLTQFYQLVIYQEKKSSSNEASKNPRQVRIMESISDSFETLLDRMALNVEALSEIDVIEEIEPYHIRMMMEWCRSIMAVNQWIFCCKEKKREEQEGLATLVTTLDDASIYQKRMVSIASTNQTILTQKSIQVLSKIAQKKKSIIRKIMQNMLASLDATRMHYMVKDLQKYLQDHYHTGPYKHGLEDTVIMALKCLELIYQSSMKNPTSPIIPPSAFYSQDICKKLNIKNEFRIWKRVLLYGEGRHSNFITRQGETEYQRRSRLFMTTASTSSLLPYPFENEYQFSWFSYPFLLPPSIKRKIVLIDAMSQMSLEYEDACVNHTLVVHAQKLLSEAPRMLKSLETNLRSATCPYLLLEIRREHFVADTLSQMSRKWSDLKKPLKVKFIEGGEEGMDQGGVQKEFFGVLFEKLVSSSVGLFSQDENTRLCWIRPVLKYDVRMYEMVGVMMGLSIYNGVIMNLQFPKILWKILVMPNEALIEAMAERHQLFTLEDLEEGWPALGNGLRQLLNWQGSDVEDIFCRDYEISIEVFGQGIVTTPLMPGQVVPVTNENREAYVRDYCTYFMYTAQKQQLLALRRGMWSVIGSRALSLCTAEELEMVACGLRQGPDALDLNMSDLESVAEYDDGYSADHPTIRQFWSVVHHDLSNEQKKQLLLFVTASDRVPVGGLKELSFYIQRNGPDSDRLPTALTCFSRLLLPEYATRQKLRNRLITAIENTKGFGLV